MTDIYLILKVVTARMHVRLQMFFYTLITDDNMGPPFYTLITDDNMGPPFYVVIRATYVES